MALLLRSCLGELRRESFREKYFPAALVGINADHYLEERKGAGTFGLTSQLSFWSATWKLK
jgi:hypothetical protein